MMKKVKIIFYTLYVVITACYHTHAQNSTIDSLLGALKLVKEDTGRLTILVGLSEVCEVKDILKYAEPAVKLSESILLKEKSSKTILRVKTNQALAYNNMGFVFDNSVDIPRALEYYHKSLKIREDIGQKKGIAQSLNNICLIYDDQGNMTKALEFGLRSLKIREEINDKAGIATCYNNLGAIYFAHEKFEESLLYHQKGLKIREEMSDKYGMAYSYQNIGAVLNHQNKLKEALDCFEKSLKLREEIKDRKGIAFSLQNIGYIYLKQKKYAEAKIYLNKALQISKELGYPENIKEAAEFLKILNKKQNNFKEALEMYELAIQMRDSIYNEKNKNESIKKQFQYEYEKKEVVAKAEQEKKDLTYEEQSKRQKIIIFSVALGLLLVVVFSIFLYRRFLITNKQKQIIELQKIEVDKQRDLADSRRLLAEQQKHIIEEKNKEIIDSITYAQRIQQAMLTSENYIKKELKQVEAEHFILFKPKDIVSGDFYWFYKNENCLFYITADSTGHGVPGGFMSMLGINLLNDIVIERGITDPGKILNKLREEIVRSLKTDEGYTKDGMDAILCKIDFEKHTLEYSAANNSFYIIRKGELIEQKAQKMPVGYMEDMHEFVTISIPLQKGDCIYTFTDGYADQFGGPKGKKYKYKQLEEKLLMNFEKGLEEQNQILNISFDEWKGNMEQIDDVCIIGIRI